MNGLKCEREARQAFASLNNASSPHYETFLQPVGVLGGPQQNPQLEQNVVTARRRPKAFPVSLDHNHFHWLLNDRCV